MLSTKPLWADEPMAPTRILDHLRFDAFAAHLFGVGHPEDWSGPTGHRDWCREVARFGFPRPLVEIAIREITGHRADATLRELVLGLYHREEFAGVRADIDASFARDHTWLRNSDTPLAAVATDRTRDGAWLRVPLLAPMMYAGWPFRAASAVVVDRGYTSAEVEAGWALLTAAGPVRADADPAAAVAAVHAATLPHRP